MQEASPVQTNDCSTSPGLPGASLIIPSRNRPELLLAAINSILSGEEVPTELIIIDQSNVPHPTLTTFSTDRACDIRYVWTDSIGASRARNAGIAMARREIIVFTDDDVTVPSTWFGSLIRRLRCGGRRTIVTGRVLPTASEDPGGFAPSTKVDESPTVYFGRIDGDVLFTNNAAMYRSAIDEVGNFDVRLGPGAPFSNAEDNDLGFRLLEAGYRIAYVPEAVLYHRAWRNERDLLPLRWSYGRGQGAFYAKHLRLTDRYMLWRMVRTTKDHAFGFAYRLRRQRRLAYGDAIYILGLLSGATHWILTQRRTQ
jgi:GT2 family glycosyltransferase